MPTNSTELLNYSRSMNIYSQPNVNVNDTINEAQKMKRKLAAQESQVLP